MNTTDPTGEGGGGGQTIALSPTNIEQTASPVTPVTGSAITPSSQQQHPPPSPLSGCYLLVVLPEPHTTQHKDLILNRLAKGFLSWDKDSCHVDLEKELLALVAQAPDGEEARNGERLIQYATENLVTEVLIHPQTNTLLQCIRNLLASFTKHRHIIHAGYTFGGNGSWILQDGTFSLADFLDAFSEHEVQRVLRAYENSVTVDIHCAGVGDWTTNRLSKEVCTRSCRVRVNPDDVLTAGLSAIGSFTNYIGQYLVGQTLEQLMEPSDVVGNIRFSHPTLYVFPGGQGDAALFGINGFNMLVDGGFARKACFWDFTRHLDRLDAVLLTRINNSNVGGMSSVLRKKREMHVYPQIGHFFCNLVERRQSNSPDGDKDIDPLILNLTDIGQEMVVNLRHINLRAHPCYRDPEPINLYHKVGHGTLDMYVLSPTKDSREVREFLAKWHASDSKLFAGGHKKDSNNLTFPIPNLVSICALLVWQPANPEDTITRILFPGSTPQQRIFDGFERLKHLEFLKHPVCSAKSLSPSASLATIKDKPAKQKLSLIEKEPPSKKVVADARKEKKESPDARAVKTSEESTPRSVSQGAPIIPTKPPAVKAEVKAKKAVENKRIEVEGKKIEKESREGKRDAVKRETPRGEKQPLDRQTEERLEKREEDGGQGRGEGIRTEAEKAAGAVPPAKETKPKGVETGRKKESREAKVGGVGVGTIKSAKPEATPKSKVAEKKPKQPTAERKDGHAGVAVKSSPTTPKKSVNGAASKTELSKASLAKGRQSIGQRSAVAPPAKSTKDANNRKVVEQKNIEKSAIKETTGVGAAAKVSAKPKPMDRKSISRRGKPVSPSKVRVTTAGSPAKSTRSTPTASVKSEKDGVIRKAKGDKGTADSSTVSTPSGIDAETGGRLVEKSLMEQSEDISLDSIESKVLADLKEEREVVEEIEAVLQKAERSEEARKDDRSEGDDEITAELTDKKEEDITEDEIIMETDTEEHLKGERYRKSIPDLIDEYLIVEKEEDYTEDSTQSGEGEQKHILDEAESEKAKMLKDMESVKEKGAEEEVEEKEKDESVEKREVSEQRDIDTLSKVEEERTVEPIDLSPDRLVDERFEEGAKETIAAVAEATQQKVEEKDDSGKKDSEDITKEPSSLSPDKLDSSEKKTTDTDFKPEVDHPKEQIPEKLEESQERISTLESGATTTAPTLPEDERIPLDEIKEDIDEKHVIEEVKEKDVPAKVEVEVPAAPTVAPVVRPLPSAVTSKPEVQVFDVRQAVQSLQRDIVKTPDEVADLPVHEEVDPKLYRMEDFEKGKEEKMLPPAAQEIKEPPTPPIKEQKGVFSFFGKVADKFEKGIDKLTKKTRKDQERDTDDKSSSKSSSPKEAKAHEKTLLEDVDMEKMFPKVGSKPGEKTAEPLHETEIRVSDAKRDSVISEPVQRAKPEIEGATTERILEDAEAKKKVEPIVSKSGLEEKEEIETEEKEEMKMKEKEIEIEEKEKEIKMEEKEKDIKMEEKEKVLEEKEIKKKEKEIEIGEKEKEKEIKMEEQEKDIKMEEKDMEIKMEEKEKEEIKMEEKEKDIKMEEKEKVLEEKEIKKKEKEIEMEEKEKEIEIEEKEKEIKMEEKEKDIKMEEKEKDIKMEEKEKDIKMEEKEKDIKMEEKEKDIKMEEKEKEKEIKMEEKEKEEIKMEEKEKDIKMEEKEKVLEEKEKEIKKKEKEIEIEEKEKEKEIKMEEKEKDIKMEEKEKDIKMEEKEKEKEIKMEEKEKEEIKMEEKEKDIKMEEKEKEKVKELEETEKVKEIKETGKEKQMEIEETKKEKVLEEKEKEKVKELEEREVGEISSIDKQERKEDVAVVADTMRVGKEEELVEGAEEDSEDVKALLEEASKKFKTVKDSLRDSLESLEERIDEEAIEPSRDIPPLKDAIKDTLEGVVEKLEAIQPQIEGVPSDTREPEKVTFEIARDEDAFEGIEGPTRDVKEAVRDVGEVLAGTAGIDIDDKPKDVTEIVKKVAQVLKEDDFLSGDVLFKKLALERIEQEKRETEESEKGQKEREEEGEEKHAEEGEKAEEKFAPPTAAAATKSPTTEDIGADSGDTLSKVDDKIAAMPTKVGIAEGIPLRHEEIQEIAVAETHEEPCVKLTRVSETVAPVADEAKDKRDAKEICEEILKERDSIVPTASTVESVSSKMDVMEAGLEDTCVKVAARKSFDEERAQAGIEVPVIAFDQKVSPAKAEIVMVSPGSTPTSPKFVTDKAREDKLVASVEAGVIPLQLPDEIKHIIDKVDRMVEEIIEELVLRKKKITMKIIEYIIIVRCIPRERVIYIIEEIITKHKLTVGDVVDNIQTLKLEESITPGLKTELEAYVIDEYVAKGKRITIEIIEEISTKKTVPKSIVILIIQEIAVKRQIDVSTEVLSISRSLVADDDGKEAGHVLLSFVDTMPASKLEEELGAGARGEELDVEEVDEVEEEDEIEEDGFVSIGRKVSGGSPTGTDDIRHALERKHEKDSSDDFEAVEQEYKVHGVPIASPADRKHVAIPKSDEGREREYAEEAVEDTVSEVIEADEKFVPEPSERDETKEVFADAAQIIESRTEKVDGQESKVSDTVVEVAVTSDTIGTVAKELTKVIDETIGQKETAEETRKTEHVTDAVPLGKSEQVKIEKQPIETPMEEKVKSVEIIELTPALVERTIDKQESTEDTEAAQKMGASEEEKAEGEEDKGAAKPEMEVTDAVASRDGAKSESIDLALGSQGQLELAKVASGDEKTPEKATEAEESVRSVRRMLVTATSEDGGHETEISGALFTKAVTPDDSLKEVCVKSTPDKDSLLLDKDSLHSGMSSPEKDSISERSPLTKDLGKVTPEDSLDKSPIDARESHDLEDSLEKISKGVDKSKETDSSTSSPVIDAEISKSRPEEKSSDPGSATDIVVDITEKKELHFSEALVAEKIEPIESLGDAVVGTSKSIDSIRSEGVSPAEPIEATATKTGLTTLETSISTLTTEAASVLETLTISSRIDDAVDDVRKIEGSADEEKILPVPCDEESEILKGKKLVETKKDDKTEVDVHHETAPITDADTLEGKKGSSETMVDKTEGEEKVVESKMTIVSGIEPPIVADKLDTTDDKVKVSDKIPTIADSSAAIDTSKSVVVDSTSLSEIETLKSPRGSIDKEHVAEIHEKSDAMVHEVKITVAPHEHTKEPIDSFKPSLPVALDAEAPTEEKTNIPYALEEAREFEDKSGSVSSQKGEERKVVERLTEISKSKSPIIAADISVVQDADTKTSDKTRSPSITSASGEEKYAADRSKSPSIVDDKHDFEDIDKPTDDGARSLSVTDIPTESKDTDTIDIDKDRTPIVESIGKIAKDASDKSKSPSINGDVFDSQMIDAKASEMERSSSVASVLSEYKDASTRSKSPSIAEDDRGVEDVDRKTDDQASSPSSKTIQMDSKDALVKLISDSVNTDIIGLQDTVTTAVEKTKAISVTSVDVSKDGTGKLKSPSVMGDVPHVKDVDTKCTDIDRSLSITSVAGEGKDTCEKSKTPSIAGDVPDPKEIDSKSTKKDRSPSVTSVAGEGKEGSEKSKSPSIAGDVPDIKDTDLKQTDKDRSPSVTSVAGEGKDASEKSKTPSIAGDVLDIKDADLKPPEKDRSPSVTSVAGEGKDGSQKSKSSSIASDEPDIKDVDLKPTEKDRSPSVTSVAGEGKDGPEKSKSPSIAGDVPDIKDVDLKPTEKDRSPSVTSVAGEGKDGSEKSKSPSIAGDVPDIKDVDLKPTEKDRSPSVTSVAGEGKDGPEKSKSPSIAGDVPDIKDVDLKPTEKDRSPSVTSVAGEGKDGSEKSKSPSIAGDVPDIKDVDLKPTEKDRSPSVTSVAGEGKDGSEKSKSPSIASDVPDIKDVDLRPTEDRSPSVTSVAGEGKDGPEKTKSPSIAGDVPDIKDVDLKPTEKDRSPSATSFAGEGKDGSEKSKSPSIAGDVPDIKDVDLKPTEKDRSPSVTSGAGEGKDGSEKSKSPSIASDVPDIKDVDLKPTEKDRSPSVTSGAGEGKDGSEKSKSPSIASDVPDIKDVDLKPTEKDRSPSVTSVAGEGKDGPEKSKSPSIAGDVPDIKDVDLKPTEKDRSPSVTSVAGEGKDGSEKSKSPSIASDVPDIKDVDLKPTEKDRSPSVTSVAGEGKDGSEKSKSPSIASDVPDIKDVDLKRTEKDRSPSVTSVPDERKDASEKSETPSIAGDVPDIKDADLKQADKDRSPSVTSVSGEGKDASEKSKTPSIAGDVPDTKDADLKPTEKGRSPSVTSVSGEGKDASEKSKTPSIAGDVPHLKDIDSKSTEKDRSSSVTSVAGEGKEGSETSKSPSIAGEVPDIKDVDLKQIEKDRSPSVSSVAGEGKDASEKSKTPSIAGDVPDLKDIDSKSTEKDRSASVTSVAGEGKEGSEKSKSPSIAGEVPDIKEVDLKQIEKDRSPSVSSVAGEGKDASEKSKTPSIAGDVPDLKDIDSKSTEKDRSPSVTSVVGEGKEGSEKSKSPSIAGDVPDIKDADLKQTDKDRSPSVTSVSGEGKDASEKSKTPSIAGDVPDTKDADLKPTEKGRSPSVTSVAGEDKDASEKSKTPSIAGDVPDLKDIDSKSTEKDRSPSVTSVVGEGKEGSEKSKSPSIAGDVPDIKDADLKQTDKDRSPSVTSVSGEGKDASEKSKTPSIAGDVPDTKDADLKRTEKGRSPSVTSVAGEDKDASEKSKTPSIAGDVPEVKDADLKQSDKGRSPSVTSVAGEDKDASEKSKTPSIAGDVPEVKDADLKPTEKDRSPSVTSVVGEGKEGSEKSKSPSIAGDVPGIKDADLKQTDKDRSPSVTSVSGEGKDASEKSKTPSIAGDVPDIKDADLKPTEKGRSPSVTSVAGEDKDASEKSKTPSIAGDVPEVKDADLKPTVKDRSPSVTSVAGEDKDASEKSKTPSIAGDVPDVKDVDSTPTEKDRSLSVTSVPDERKDASEKSKTPSIAGDVPDIKDVDLKPTEKDRSPSVTSVASEAKDGSEKSKSPSIAGDVPDIKDVDSKSTDRDRSASLASVVGEGKDATDQSKTPSIADEAPDMKDVDAKPIDKDRSHSVTSVPGDGKDGSEKSKSPSAAGDAPVLKDVDTKLIDRDSSPSVTKDTAEKSISPVIPDDVPDMKDVDGKLSDTTKPASSTCDKSESSSIFGGEKQAHDVLDKPKSTASEELTFKAVSAYETEMSTVGKMDKGKTRESLFDVNDTTTCATAAAQPVQEEVSIDDSADKLLSALIKKQSAQEGDAMKVATEQETNIRKYILEEYIHKKKKITTVVIEDIIKKYSISEFQLMKIIEMIITTENVCRDTLLDITKVKQAQEKEQDREEEEQLHRDARDTSDASICSSLSSEMIASDKSTQDSPVRSEPHIDEEISISEEKRTEVEKFLVEEYVRKKMKITEEMLEEICVRLSLPRYIIVDIIEEIILKRKLDRDTIIDVEVYEDDEAEASLEKDGRRYEKSPELGRYDLAGADTKMPYDYKPFDHPEPQEGRSETSISDYPRNYESQFHKVFVGGMTEIRTTHITTLSRKSTPDIIRGGTPDSVSETAVSTFERVQLEGKLSDSDGMPDGDAVSTTPPVHPAQKVSVLKESKIDETVVSRQVSSDKAETPASVIESEASKKGPSPDADSSTSKDSMEKHDDRSEVLEDVVIVKRIVKELETDRDESDTIRKIVGREVIKEGEPVTITKIIKREIIVPEGEFDETEASERMKEIATMKKIVSTSEKQTTEDRVSTVVMSIDERKMVTETIDLDTAATTSKGETTIMKETQTKSTESMESVEKKDKSERLAKREVKEAASAKDEEAEEDEIEAKYGGKDRYMTSPLVRDIASEGSVGGVQSHASGRSTPDRRSEGRSLTGTPEGFRSGEVIRTIITTTKTVSDDGEIVTTTREVTETTNEKGETVVLAEKVDVKVDEYLPSRDDFTGYRKEEARIPEPKAFQEDIEKRCKDSGPFQTAREDDYKFKPFTVEKEYAGDYKERAKAKKYVDEADLDFEKALTMEPKTSKESKPTDQTAGGDSKSEDDKTDMDKDKDKHTEQDSGAASKRDPLDGWGKPLGLPSPIQPQKFNLKNLLQPVNANDRGAASTATDTALNFNAVNEWGEPLRLPSPAPVATEMSNKAAPGTPKKEKKQARKVLSENLKNKKRSESPGKNEKKMKDSKNKLQPVYVDLTYVPHHGNSYYTSLEFFKRVRARYYVFSGTEPSREVYDALLEAKRTWEDKDLEVTMIPTYDTDTLGYWVADNEEALAANHIDLSPSASRCTINLQDHETSCSAYRLEF